jgi:hypothetical protein
MSTTHPANYLSTAPKATTQIHILPPEPSNVDVPPVPPPDLHSTTSSSLPTGQMSVEEKLARLKGSVVPFKEWRAKRSAANAAKPTWSEHHQKNRHPDEVVIQGGDFRQRIKLAGTNREIRDVSDELGSIVSTKGLYLRGDDVFYYDETDQQLRHMRPVLFTSWVQDFVCCLEAKSNAADTMEKSEAEQILVATQFRRHLPVIRRVYDVPVPIRRADGKVELLPTGYDNESGVLVTNSAAVSIERWSLDKAKDYLLDLLEEFAFEPTNRAQQAFNQIGFMLGMFGDTLIDPAQLRPVWLFVSNAEGSGKTLCARVGIVPVHGPIRISPPPERHGEELKKLLLSAVIAAAPYIVFDNWKGKIGGSALEAFATSRMWTDRILGKSATVALENLTNLLITANDATVTPDMRRRCMAVELFVEAARAEDRKVRRELSESVLMAERSNILSALWTLIAEWSDQGCPKGTKVSGSFPAWCETIGGIMEAAGWGAPADALKQVRGGDEDLRDFDKMLEMIGRMTVADLPDGFGQVEAERYHVKSGPLMAYARDVGLFANMLAEDPPTSDLQKRQEGSRFGKVCKRFTGRVLPSGWRFEVSDHESRTNRHFIVRR